MAEEEERRRRAINVLMWMLIEMRTGRLCEEKIAVLRQGATHEKKMSSLAETGSSLLRVVWNGQCKTLSRRTAK